MKIVRIVFFCFTLASFGAAHAQSTDRGFYLGGGAGGAKYNGFNELCRDVAGALPAGALDTSCDSSETAFSWKLFGGWRWNQYVALEAGLANLGEAKGDTIIAGRDVDGEVSSTAIFGEILGSVPLGERFRLFAKLGVASVDVELTASALTPLGGLSPKLSKDSTEAVYGAGLEFGITQKVMGRAEWERFDFEDGIDFFSVSIVFYPGQ